MVVRLALALVLSVSVSACGQDEARGGNAEPRSPTAPGPTLAPAPAPPAGPSVSSAGGLTVLTLGAPPPVSRTAVVLLHGYGAAGADLLPLARAIHTPPTVRFLLPAAPVVLDEAADRRAWWDVVLPLAERVDGRPVAAPPALVDARAQVNALLDQLEAEGTRHIILGGFSQGAMLAMDVAIHRPRPLAGVAFLSGTRVNAAAWRAGFPRLRGVPIVIAHGTDDPVLPFAAARVLRDDLVAAGAAVDWVEYPDGHTIARPALVALARLIQRADVE